MTAGCAGGARRSRRSTTAGSAPSATAWRRRPRPWSGSWQGLPTAGADVDVDALALGITLDVVGRTLFDRDLTGQTQRLVHATDEAAELVVAQAQTVPLPSWVPTTAHRRLRAAVHELDSLCRELTAERRARGVGERDSDLLGLLDRGGARRRRHP